VLKLLKQIFTSFGINKGMNKIKKYLSWFILVELLISLWVIPLFAEQCHDITFQKNSISNNSIQTFWSAQFISAHQNGDSTREIYALLKWAENSNKRLSLSKDTLTSIKGTLLNLELLFLDEEFSKNGFAGNFLSHFFNFIGLSPIFQKKIEGASLRLSLSQKMNFLAAVKSDLYYLIGPLFFSFVEHPNFVKSDHSENKNNIISLFSNLAYDFFSENSVILNPLIELAAIEKKPILKINYDLNLKTEEVFKKIQSDVHIKTWNKGRIIFPWIITLIILLTQDESRTDYFTEPVKNLIPYGYQKYTTEEFLNDVEKQIGILKNKKILIIYTSNIASQVDSLPNPLFGFSSLESIENGNNNIDAVKIEHMSDLKNLNLNQFDDIIIFAHGLPDYVSGFNLEAKDLPKLKLKANLIFFSCLVGQKGLSDGSENWVEFSKAILDKGKAIVVTQEITGQYKKEVTNQKFKTSMLTHKITEFIGEGFGILQIVLPIIYLGEKMSEVNQMANEYYFEPKGIRIYDSATGKTEFYKSTKLIPERN
jgi:hypothetical protein